MFFMKGKKNYTCNIDIGLGRILGSVIIVNGIVVINGIGSIVMNLKIVNWVMITSRMNCWIWIGRINGRNNSSTKDSSRNWRTRKNIFVEWMRSRFVHNVSPGRWRFAWRIFAFQRLYEICSVWQCQRTKLQFIKNFVFLWIKNKNFKNNSLHRNDMMKSLAWSVLC